MCFVIKKVDATPKIAEEDITVYKVIKKDGSGIYFSMMPYNTEVYDSKGNIVEFELKQDQGESIVPWTLGMRYKIKGPEFEKSTSPTALSHPSCDLIEGGCFHAYTDRELTCNWANKLSSVYKLIELTIPKGSKYMISGMHVVSNQVIYSKKLT